MTLHPTAQAAALADELTAWVEKYAQKICPPGCLPLPAQEREINLFARIAIALRQPQPSGAVLREALEDEIGALKAKKEMYGWQPNTPAWERCFGEMAGLNRALQVVALTVEAAPVEVAVADLPVTNKSFETSYKEVMESQSQNGEAFKDMSAHIWAAGACLEDADFITRMLARKGLYLFQTEPWNRCPSAHCERRGECAGPRDCTIKTPASPDLTTLQSRADGSKT